MIFFIIDCGFIVHFKVGVVSVRDAIQMAEDSELDLVCYSFFLKALLLIYECYLYNDVVSLHDDYIAWYSVR